MTAELKHLIEQIDDLAVRNGYFEGALGSSMIRTSLGKIQIASGDRVDSLPTNLMKLRELLRTAMFGASRGFEADMQTVISTVDGCLILLTGKEVDP